jgi:hypothetical protein
MPNLETTEQCCLYCNLPTDQTWCPRCQTHDARPLVVLDGELSERYAQEWREWQERLPAA